MGEFPQGEAPGATEPGGGSGTEQTTADASGNTEAGGNEPGWGDSAGAGSEELPDLLDDQSMEEVLAAMEAAMGEGAQSGGQPPGGGQGEGAQGGGQPPGDGQGAGASASGNSRAGAGRTGTGSGIDGPLTPAEQVAVLDAQLERGTGVFDAMILEEQAEQRSEARERAATNPPPESASQGGGTAGDGGGMADAGEYGGGGGYSTGGGMGGASQGGGTMPTNTAKYPPPADIPNGTDDDVVARQLREAAMREPDPAVREKLWDEYRKYKGIAE
jgi:hypothetical protein